MKYFRMCLPIFRGGAKKEAEDIFCGNIQSLNSGGDTGRATKEKHDEATATDMQKDGLFSKKKLQVVPKMSLMDGWKCLKITPAAKKSTNKFYLFCVFLPLKKYCNRLS